MEKIWRFFERLVPPFPDNDKLGEPPRGFIRFILFYSHGLWPFLAMLAVLTSLMAAGEALTIEKIYRAITLCHKTLKMAGFASPRIGVAALNPHCGEGGLCGREEIDVIGPAIEKAKADGMNAMGPFSSDILFYKAFGGDFDGVVTMYHDQGQIALKLKGFDGGITIAGGQPVPVVTCGHGTAYDIAGKNIVHTTSFENAIKMASQMAVHNAK